MRHCLVDLDQDGIWLTGGIGEFWSLTTEELKSVVAVATEEARKVKPGALVQVMSSTDTAKQCVELTLHAQDLGVDICYILTPYFECSGKPGVLQYLRYVADRTDMPLGFFNSHSTGLVLTPSECVELYREIPALCGLKNGLLDAQHSLAVHQLAPDMVLWEADDEAGIRLGIPHPGALGSALYLYEKPGLLLFSRVACPSGGRRLRTGREVRRRDRSGGYEGREPALPGAPGPAGRVHALGRGIQVRCQPARPSGGRLPHSRPPQTAFPDELKDPIRSAYAASGFIKS